jgi:hypothetical protein
MYWQKRIFGGKSLASVLAAFDRNVWVQALSWQKNPWRQVSAAVLAAVNQQLPCYEYRHITGRRRLPDACPGWQKRIPGDGCPAAILAAV